jgi:NADH:ubiquinone oxidoreductase subunit 5 (subunit L)/multisubunit Na+/H+ antiporter MnhA subunit
LIDIWDIAFPIMSLVSFSLLTVVFFRFIRKNTRRTLFSLLWYVIVYAVVFASVGSLAVKYNNTGAPQPVNITLSDTPFSALSSSFMIDSVSIYMSVIIVGVSAVVFLYALFYIPSDERPYER